MDVDRRISELSDRERHIYENFTGTGLFGLPEFRSGNQGFSLCRDLEDTDISPEDYRNWYRCMFAIAAANMYEEIERKEYEEYLRSLKQ